MFDYFFHSTKINDSECHLSSSNFDKSDVFSIVEILYSNEMINIVIFGCFKITFDGYFVSILEFHGSVWIKAFSDVKSEILQLFRTFSFFEDECFGCEALLLCVRLLMASYFFLDKIKRLLCDLQL